MPPGRRRVLWGAAAVAFSIVMGLSRAYLAAHWLSDATAGILLGTSCALVTALIADQLQRRHNQEAATHAAATPGWRSPAPPRRKQQVRGMNMDRTQHSGTRLSDPPAAAE